jgi:hypothetical protein
LPELSRSEKEDLLARYNDIIADIGLENTKESVWWYTWSSCRDRFHSRILADMELLARFQKACALGLPGRLALLCSDPHLVGPLADVARQNGYRPHISMRDRLLWKLRRLERKSAPLVLGLKICARAFINKVHLGRTRVSFEQPVQSPPKILLVTWIKAKNLLENGAPTDTFFGRLPEFMANQKHPVIVFGDISDRLSHHQEKGRLVPNSPVVTLGDFLSLWDIVLDYVRGFLSPISVPKPLKAKDSNLSSLIERDIYANRSTVVYCLLFESALRRLVRWLRPTEIIHSCENNAWERACSRVASTLVPQPEVMGYMHCAVLLSHTKIVITEKEKPVRPRPQRIICTGPRARDIMVRLGGHSPDEVEAGCALRHEYLREISPREKLNRPIRNILVVLEGLSSMSRFVRFIYDALDGEERFSTMIRPHPAYSIDRILREAGLSTSQLKTLSISDHNLSIMQDFEDADLVVYKGSTAALEAGYLGIPLIHVESQSLLTDDPLFEITSLKRVVYTPEELIPAIDAFSAMQDSEFLRQHETLRKYIEEYLVMPSEDSASVFLPRSLKGMVAVG